MTREQILSEIQNHEETIERVETDLGLWRLLGYAEDIAECERILVEERAWLAEYREELRNL